MSEEAPKPLSGGDKPDAPYPLAPQTSEPAAASAPAPSPAATPAPQVVVVREELPLSRPGWFTWQVYFTVGVTTLITAAILAAVEASRAPRPETSGWAPRGFVAAVQTLLIVPASAALGVAALWIAARTLGRRLGDKRLAFSRMFGACGIVALVVTLGPLVINVPLLEWVIAAGVYVLVIWTSFRLSRNNTLLVGALHLALCGVAAGIVWATPRLLRSGGASDAPPAPPAATEPAPTTTIPDPALPQ